MRATRRSVICECGSDNYEAYEDGDNDRAPMWECCNCCKRTPRQVRARGTTMTATQRRVITALKRDILEREGTTGRYEYKQWEATMTDYGPAMVIAVVGMVGDEGTAASMLCRTHRQIFIGRRGGCSYYTEDRDEMKRGYWNAVRSAS